MPGKASPALRPDPLDHFFEFWIGHLTGSLSQLFVMHGGGEYERLANRIGARAALPCTVVDFLRDPARVKDIAIGHRADAHAAVCVVYVLDYARLAKDD